MYTHMLIDARNAAYRAVHAGLCDEFFKKTGQDFSVIYFRFLSTYIRRFKPDAVHMFWDAPKTELWRKAIWPTYKEGRDTSNKYGPEIDVGAIIERTCEVVTALAPYINVRNYYRPRQEADDLIYTFCRLHRTGSLVIVSSDGDFKQIPFMFANVDLFSPMTKEGREGQVAKIDGDVDPVEIKCFTGEKTDNILGYSQIGPVRAEELIKDNKKRNTFLDTRGHEIYRRNRALVDLSLCPYMLHNMTYIQEVLSTDVAFDIPKMREVIQTYKVKGLMGEISGVLLPFKFVGNQTAVEGSQNGVSTLRECPSGQT